MKKKIRKILKRTLLSIFILLAIFVTTILYPQILFANKLRYNNFKVHSNDKINSDIKFVLDKAMDLVKESELYDPNYKYNIILCHNTFYNKIDDKVFGVGPAARPRLNTVLVKVRIDASNNLAFPTFRKACEIKLDYLIAHEMIHCLQAHKYGIRKFNPFNYPPVWKLEGYPEYIARKPELTSADYSLINEIEHYVDLVNKASDMWIVEKTGCESPNYYYRGRLMIEYLMDIKHLSYDQILKDTVSERTIFREMIEWKDRTKQ